MNASQRKKSKKCGMHLLKLLFTGISAANLLTDQLFLSCWPSENEEHPCTSCLKFHHRFSIRFRYEHWQSHSNINKLLFEPFYSSSGCTFNHCPAGTGNLLIRSPLSLLMKSIHAACCCHHCWFNTEYHLKAHTTFSCSPKCSALVWLEFVANSSAS